MLRQTFLFCFISISVNVTKNENTISMMMPANEVKGLIHEFQRSRSALKSVYISPAV